MFKYALVLMLIGPLTLLADDTTLISQERLPIASTAILDNAGVAVGDSKTFLYKFVDAVEGNICYVTSVEHNQNDPAQVNKNFPAPSIFCLQKRKTIGK